MADEKETGKKETGTKSGTQRKATDADVQIPEESVYTVEDFLAARTTVFGKRVRPECIIAAFKIAGKTETTVSEAKKIVNDFRNKEVK